MRHRTTLSLILTINLLLSLPGFTSLAQGEVRRRFAADTGIITLGQNQVLRISVNAGAGDDTIIVSFRRMEYTQGACNGGVCAQAVASQTTSNPMNLGPGGGASIDIANTAFGVRGLVLSNNREMVVTVMIIDTVTGQIVSCRPSVDINDIYI